MSNLFGNMSTQQKPGGLFGASTTSSQPQQTGGLFGSTQQKPPSSGLFGAAPQPQPAGSLFGSTQQPQPQPAQTSGLFASTAPKPAGGLFASTTQQPAQNNGFFGGSIATQPREPSLAQSFLAGSQAAPLPRLGQSQWLPAPNPREKPIRNQMEEILLKWHPNSPQCSFQHYFYQNVGAERAPYFGVPEGEDPRKWEQALQDKPDEGSIPVLAKGFGSEGIAGRIKIQDAAAKALYDRVNEIDQSLKNRIEDHDLKFTVRAQEARRKHIALSRRCLAIATKVQVLRNRGYALDSAEEELKAKLVKLEKATFDPVVEGREEELWARMTVVRERAKMLQEETERWGKAVGDQPDESIDEETMTKIKQILSSYDSQLGHLRKELNIIKKDFEEWDTATKPASAAARKR